MKIIGIAILMILLAETAHALVIHSIIFKGITEHPKYASSWASYVPLMRYQNKTITCLHGEIITDYWGNEFCTRKYTGESLKEYQAYLSNRTINTTTVTYRYFWRNCQTVPNNWTYDGTTIVTSSHPLTCAQIRNWRLT